MATQFDRNWQLKKTLTFGKILGYTQQYFYGLNVEFFSQKKFCEKKNHNIQIFEVLEIMEKACNKKRHNSVILK